LLRRAGGAHGVDVFVTGQLAHQQFIVAETWPASLLHISSSDGWGGCGG
jgi:putative NIF3 family GTP cyclohydrolase 1 type 2